MSKYEDFRRKFDPVYAVQSGGQGNSVQVNWGSDEGAQQQQSIFNQQNNDDDDLYN